MYEEMTYEVILQRMLDKVPKDIDKREGSMIFSALAPAAAEITQAYIELGVVTNMISPDTATGYELTELAFQGGVLRKGATKSLRKGVFNTDVPLNSRFSAEGITYRVVEKINDFDYKLESEQPGEVGNAYTGLLIPVEYVEGLTSATLTDVIVPGVSEETDEQLRERYRQRIISPAQDGNKNQYKEWAEAFEGVGVAKVFPLWNGANTVKVAITDRLFQVADSTLVSRFQEYMDPGSQGLGNGIAPIGAKVTVTGGVKKEINIAGEVVLAEGFTEPEGVAEAIVKYLSSITYVKNSVSYMRTGTTVLDTSSIADLKNFTLNGGNTDIVLVGEEIPTLNSINLTVVSQ